MRRTSAATFETKWYAPRNLNMSPDVDADRELIHLRRSRRFESDTVSAEGLYFCHSGASIDPSPETGHSHVGTMDQHSFGTNIRPRIARKVDGPLMTAIAGKRRRDGTVFQQLTHVQNYEAAMFITP